MSDLCRECVLYMMEQTKLKCKNNTENLLYPSFRNGKRRSASSMEACFKELCDRLEIDRDVHVTKTGQKKDYAYILYVIQQIRLQIQQKVQM